MPNFVDDKDPDASGCHQICDVCHWETYPCKCTITGLPAVAQDVDVVADIPMPGDMADMPTILAHESRTAMRVLGMCMRATRGGGRPNYNVRLRAAKMVLDRSLPILSAQAIKAEIGVSGGMDEDLKRTILEFLNAQKKV